MERTPRIVANVPIYVAPAEDFHRVTGASNYITVYSKTPDRELVRSPALDLPETLPSEETDIFYDPEMAQHVDTVQQQHSEGLNLLVFLGSVRENRMATRVGHFIKKALEARNHHATIIDPKDHNLAVVNTPFHFYKSPADAPEYLHVIDRQIREADGFVVIAAEYNSAISPALCSLLDHFPPVSYAYRPSAIVTYSMGQFGGIRTAMQLREFMSELMTVHMPSMVVIPKVHEALNEQGGASDSATQLIKATETMISNLEWYAVALKKHRKVAGTPK